MTAFERLRRRCASIQVRITAVATAAILVMLTVAALGTVDRFERQLIEQVDRELDNDAAIVERSIAVDQVPALRRSGAVVDQVIQVVNPRGEVVEGTALGRDIAALATPASLDEGDARQHLTVEVEPGGPIRVVVKRLDGRAVVLVVARPVDQAEDAIDSLERLGWIIVPLIAALMAILVWLAVGRALRPVVALRRSVDSITDDDLSHRVAHPGTEDELARLVDTMNAMLDRVEHGVERERRFVADASHELRSPLAGARALLETESDDPAAVLESRAETLATIDRLERLVEQMLELAVIGGPHDERSPRRWVNLDELVLAQANRMRRTNDIEIDTTNVSGGQVRGHDNEIGRMIENLTTNAARHALTTVRLGVSEHGETVRFTIEDDGPGVPVSDRERVFRRFARLDASRIRDAGGTGLGLAIVDAIVADHGGTITIDESTLGGAKFVVELPRTISSGASVGSDPMIPARQ